MDGVRGSLKEPEKVVMNGMVFSVSPNAPGHGLNEGSWDGVRQGGEGGWTW
ncbi:hypothetical protein E2C01_096530 [Portunus trituberculatus]|uniref:Uncharacterized protein n=1 Tax=Portunus trituberculatus TaxID=210409 RepID=A0A5B7K1Z9_PORTR|nr:hypothetical protein [Portunus trituberculatus]